MANVPLRIYNREIESLIDQGHPSEAIAHCHHILQKYSKHLATYRLLAKAHLELKHYAEAVDIFGRVLMAMPDDFVSHVGMSIICDEQNKLDDAIWHMQRAFESQPSNPAIQGELQRLYGRRDGVEPPKVRMTRGALANMYLQGELYPQAIAEGNAVLSSDPERSDMQVLLARAYFRSGQKANASEMCADLIKKYPYSFEANRIMIELLPSTPDGAESKQLYRTRVGELDPYATFGGGSVFKADEVPDPAISFEKLEYKGGEEPEVQRWNSPLGAGSGISAAAAASSAPDWLTGGSSGAPGTQGGSAADIPDFLREAGWAESNSPEQPVSFFDEQAPVDDLTPADIPDWLKSQSPVNTAPTPITAQPGGTQSLDIPDWLQPPGAAQEDNVPAWLKGTDTKSAAPEPAKADDAPDWLSNLEGAPAGEPAGDVPDWLNNLTDTKAVEPVQAGDAPEWLSGMDEKQPAEPAEGKDVLSWLSSLDEKQSTEPVQTIDTPDWQPELDTAQINISTQPGDIPDWLTGLDDKKNTEPVSDPSNIPDWQPEFDASQVNTPAQPDNVADWLSGLDQKPTSEPAPIGDTPDWLNGFDQKPAAEPASLGENENVPDWLSGLEEKAVNEHAVTSGSPDWLKGLDSDQIIEPAPEGNLPDWLNGLEAKDGKTSASAVSVESLGATSQEQDDAVAWLESLAAKHGAKPEEMVTDPNKRSEATPEWISQAQELGTPAAITVESLGSTAQEQDDAVAWLESLAAKHGAKPEEMVTDPNKRSEATPEWVSQAQSIADAQSAPVVPVEEPKPEIVENALNIGEQFFAEFENASAAAPSTDETSAWLLNLEADEKQEQPANAVEDLPDWLREPVPQAEKSDWQVDAPQQGMDNAIEQISEHEQPVNTTQDVQAWLSETESLIENPEIQAEAPQGQDALEQVSELGHPPSAVEDIPDWLRDATPQPEKDDWQDDAFDQILVDEGQEVVKQDTEARHANMPDWLSAAETETEPVNIDADQGLPESDLASWLNSLDDEPGLPFDALPTPDSILFAAQPSGSETKSREPEFVVEASQPDWMSAAEPENVPAEDVLDSPAISKAEELPAWLQEGVETEETTDTNYNDDDAPPWMRREQWEAEEEPQHLQPTSPSDWHTLEPAPVEATTTVPAPVAAKVAAQPKQEALIESQMPFMPPSPEPSSVPAVEKAAAPAVESAQKKKISLAVRKLQPDGGNTILALTQAKGELDRGDIPAALSHYAKLIKKGKHIEETIRDLAESIYRYPVEVGIWQTLGDAYMRANRLKEALEAYNKAEELIR